MAIETKIYSGVFYMFVLSPMKVAYWLYYSNLKLEKRNMGRLSVLNAGIQLLEELYKKYTLQ